jgi:hypothetical protein
MRPPPPNEQRPLSGAPSAGLDQSLDLALQHKASVGHVTDIPGWPALAAWLGAVTP